MNLSELATLLGKLYNNSPKQEKVAMIHLFAIKYAEEIQEHNITAADLAKAAGLSKSYHVEISKGLKRAKYVVCKDNVVEKLLYSMTPTG